MEFAVCHPFATKSRCWFMAFQPSLSRSIRAKPRIWKSLQAMYFHHNPNQDSYDCSDIPTKPIHTVSLHPLHPCFIKYLISFLFERGCYSCSDTKVAPNRRVSDKEVYVSLTRLLVLCLHDDSIYRRCFRIRHRLIDARLHSSYLATVLLTMS